MRATKEWVLFWKANTKRPRNFIKALNMVNKRFNCR